MIGVTRLDVSLRDKDSRHNWESLFSKAYISVLLTEVSQSANGIL